MIELYTAATGNGRRATIMLEECGLAYRAHKVELGKAANKPSEFLTLNPQGTIPVIHDPDGPDGKPITLAQSSAILLYLAEKTGRFLPKDARKRQAAYQWMMGAVTDVAPTSTAIFLAASVMPEKVPSVAQFFESRFVDLCKPFDRRLGEAPYLAGDEITIADLAFFPVVAGRQALIDKAEGLANLKRWAAELGARPTIQRALKVAA